MFSYQHIECSGDVGQTAEEDMLLDEVHHVLSCTVRVQLEQLLSATKKPVTATKKNISVPSYRTETCHEEMLKSYTVFTLYNPLYDRLYTLYSRLGELCK